MAFWTNVLSLLASPRIRSVCELHRIARRIAFLNGRRLKEIFIVDCDEGGTSAPFGPDRMMVDLNHLQSVRLTNVNFAWNSS